MARQLLVLAHRAVLPDYAGERGEDLRGAAGLGMGEAAQPVLQLAQLGGGHVVQGAADVTPCVAQERNGHSVLISCLVALAPIAASAQGRHAHLPPRWTITCPTST